MDGASWPSKCATATSWSGCTRSRVTTGRTPIRSICRTRDCWPTSRTASRAVRRFSDSARRPTTSVPVAPPARATLVAASVQLASPGRGAHPRGLIYPVLPQPIVPVVDPDGSHSYMRMRRRHGVGEEVHEEHLMKQYLLSIYQPDGNPPPPHVLEKVMRDVNAVRQELKAAGAWVFAGGLHPPSTATVVRLQGGDLLTTDGPFTEGKEHIGGF